VTEGQKHADDERGRGGGSERRGRQGRGREEAVPSPFCEGQRPRCIRRRKWKEGRGNGLCLSKEGSWAGAGGAGEGKGKGSREGEKGKEGTRREEGRGGTSSVEITKGTLSKESKGRGGGSGRQDSSDGKSYCEELPYEGEEVGESEERILRSWVRREGLPEPLHVLHFPPRTVVRTDKGQLRGEGHPVGFLREGSSSLGDSEDPQGGDQGAASGRRTAAHESTGWAERGRSRPWATACRPSVVAPVLPRRRLLPRPPREWHSGWRFQAAVLRRT